LTNDVREREASITSTEEEIIDLNLKIAEYEEKLYFLNCQVGIYSNDPKCVPVQPSPNLAPLVQNLSAVKDAILH
jgi:hypothetical protein